VPYRRKKLTFAVSSPDEFLYYANYDKLCLVGLEAFAIIYLKTLFLINDSYYE